MQVSIVPHRLLNPGHRCLKPRVSVILFPNLIKEGEHRQETVSIARGGLKLVECLVNGRDLPRHGFDEVSRPVREAPVYTLHYTGFRTLPELFDDTLRQLCT